LGAAEKEEENEGVFHGLDLLCLSNSFCPSAGSFMPQSRILLDKARSTITKFISSVKAEITFATIAQVAEKYSRKTEISFKHQLQLIAIAEYASRIVSLLTGQKKWW